MTHYEIIKKLIGPIEPVGETNEDKQRFVNLQKTIKLVDMLLSNIEEVSANKDAPEYSVFQSGKEADEFLNDLRDSLT